jgi:hypothetical protein
VTRSCTWVSALGSGGQGFGPRLGLGFRRRRQETSAAQSAAAGRRRQAAAAAGRTPLVVTSQQADNRTALAQPGSSPEDPEQAKAMQGQQGYKQGLPSSRSDTMLLQAAEAQRFGGISSEQQGSAARAAGAATTGSSSQQPRRQAGAGTNIPVFVMLPLDTVSGRRQADRAGAGHGRAA